MTDAEGGRGARVRRAAWFASFGAALGLALCIIASVAWAGKGRAAPWEIVRDDAELKIWQRAVPDSSIREVRVEAVLGAPSRRLWQVIRNIRGHVEFLPHLKESRIIAEPSPQQRTYYQWVSPPVVSDRDYTLRARAWADDETGVYEQVFEVANGVGPPPQSDVVRIESLRGRWVLEPLGERRTRIAYWVHMDPGGVIPAWLVNFGQRITVPRLFRALERRALDPSYKL